MADSSAGIRTGRNRGYLLSRVLNSPSPQRKEIPMKVHETFRETYDLARLATVVLAKLNRDYTQSQLLCSEIDELNRRIATSPQGTDKRLLEEARDCLQLTYNRDSDLQRIEDFKLVSNEFVKMYKLVPPPSNVIDITSTEDSYEPTDDDLKRILIIKTYANFASSYMDVKLTCIGEERCRSSTFCTECNTLLDSILPEPEGYVYCPECFKKNYVKKIYTLQQESTQRGGYEDTDNFVKALDKYQGKSAPVLMIDGVKYNIDDIRVLLDEYFIREKYPVSDIIRSRPLNERGIRQGSSVSIMLKAITGVGLKCYCDVYYMCREIWWWQLVDLASIQELLVDDYRLTQKVWYEMPAKLKERASSLPIWYRVCQHLRRRGHRCCSSDFKIPKNVSLYNEIWKYMCNNCGDPEMRYAPL